MDEVTALLSRALEELGTRCKRCNTPKRLVEDSAFRDHDQQSFVIVITMASLSLGWGTS